MPDLSDKVLGYTLIVGGIATTIISGVSFFNLYENIKNFDTAMKHLDYVALNYFNGGVGTVLLASGIAALVHGYRVFYPKAEVVAQPKAVARPAAPAQSANTRPAGV